MSEKLNCDPRTLQVIKGQSTHSKMMAQIKDKDKLVIGGGLLFLYRKT